MIIDVHAYCLPDCYRDPAAELPAAESQVINAIYRHPDSDSALRLASPDSIISSMDRSGITHTLLIPLPWSSHDRCLENNSFILEAASRNPRFLAACTIQPLNRDWHQEAERCLDAGAIALKLNPQWQGFDTEGKEMDDVILFLEERDRVLMLHVDHPYRKSNSSAAHLLNLARKHPHARILATHMGGMLGLYAGHPPVSQYLGNICFDTAVSSTLHFIRLYVDLGLQERLVFGSDFPFNHSHSQEQVVSGIRALDLGHKAEEAIFYRNFLSLFNLEK